MKEEEKRRSRIVSPDPLECCVSALCISDSCIAVAQVYHSKDNLRGEQTTH